LTTIKSLPGVGEKRKEKVTSPRRVADTDRIVTVSILISWGGREKGGGRKHKRSKKGKNDIESNNTTERRKGMVVMKQDHERPGVEKKKICKIGGHNTTGSGRSLVQMGRRE